jgi:RNA polymerase sigma-70 factor (ECF subfamily)
VKKVNFDEVYDRYFDDVYRYVFALSRNDSIAEEITQETFFRALKKIENFRGECKLRVWLCQIAKNIYYSYCEKQKKRISEENIYDITDGISVEEKFLYRETAFVIHKKLHSLAEPYKEVFSLRVFGELPFYDIGELFEKNENWARVTFYRAKLKLKED